MNPIPQTAFDEIQKEIERRSLQQNNYRLHSGKGRSQAFGLVNRRCLNPDFSRQCWIRPYLYKLLLDFGDTYVRPAGVDFNAITVNENYAATKHRDKHNTGNSFLVAFGSFTGGALVIHEGDLSGVHDVCFKPIITDFSKVYHSVNEFDGKRFSLVYYTLVSKRPLPEEKPSVVFENGSYIFKRGDVKITNGLPHPLKGRKKKTIEMNKEDGEFIVSFE